MDAELQTRVNLPVVLINRKGLYVIVAVLGVSILGCAGVLAYSFSNYAKLKRNAEEVHSYIASRTKAPDHPSGGKDTAAVVAGVTLADDRASNAKTTISLAARSDQVANAGFSAQSGIPQGQGIDDAYGVVARKKVSMMARADPHFRPLNTVYGEISNVATATNMTGFSGVANQL